MAGSHELRLPCLAVRQGEGRTLYSFGVDGKLLPRFAVVSRASRNDDAVIEGYQRPEVLSHITAIRRYLESENPMIPNAIVVAFDSRVRFEPGPNDDATPYSQAGTIVIPVDETLDDLDKPGWIVDGQQRTAAIREAAITEFPICVVAFIADNEADQRAQFILVNSTKPLPKGLIYELLPTTDEFLPAALQRRRLPSRLLERLNYESDSPLCGLINTPTNPTTVAADGRVLGIVKDNSILRMLDNSLTDGALYRFRDPRTGSGDDDPMTDLLKNYWSAVRETFSDAWGLPPRKSRLMHGVGIVSLGFVMDAIADRFRDGTIPPAEFFSAELALIAPMCKWTAGYWEFGPTDTRKWNFLQNTPRDIQLLTNHLLFAYRRTSRDVLR